jgi:ABC-type nitrate/sulfonate/bicarbonate transport system permease component
VSARPWASRLHLPTLGVAVVMVAGWVLLSWRYGAYVLPSPLAVARGFADIVVSGEIWRHSAAAPSPSRSWPASPGSSRAPPAA